MFWRNNNTFSDSLYTVFEHCYIQILTHSYTLLIYFALKFNFSRRISLLIINGSLFLCIFCESHPIVLISHLPSHGSLESFKGCILSLGFLYHDVTIQEPSYTIMHMLTAAQNRMRTMLPSLLVLVNTEGLGWAIVVKRWTRAISWRGRAGAGCVLIRSAAEELPYFTNSSGILQDGYEEGMEEFSIEESRGEACSRT